MPVLNKSRIRVVKLAPGYGYRVLLVKYFKSEPIGYKHQLLAEEKTEKLALKKAALFLAEMKRKRTTRFDKPKTLHQKSEILKAQKAIKLF